MARRAQDNPKGVDAHWGTVGLPESRNGELYENFPLRLHSWALPCSKQSPKAKSQVTCLDSSHLLLITHLHFQALSTLFLLGAVCTFQSLETLGSSHIWSPSPAPLPPLLSFPIVRVIFSHINSSGFVCPLTPCHQTYSHLFLCHQPIPVSSSLPCWALLCFPHHLSGLNISLIAPRCPTLP